MEAPKGKRPPMVCPLPFRDFFPKHILESSESSPAPDVPHASATSSSLNAIPPASILTPSVASISLALIPSIEHVFRSSGSTVMANKINVSGLNIIPTYEALKSTCHVYVCFWVLNIDLHRLFYRGYHLHRNSSRS